MREKRKLEHLDYALITGQQRLHGLDDIQFVHQSLPEISLNEIEIKTSIGELHLSSPIFINAVLRQMLGLGYRVLRTWWPIIIKKAWGCLLYNNGNYLSSLNQHELQFLYTYVIIKSLLEICYSFENHMRFFL